MITSSYPRHENDGAGAYVKWLATRLTSMGHEIHVVAPHDPLVHKSEMNGVKVHRFRYAPCDGLCIAGHGRALHADAKMKTAVPLLMPTYALATIRTVLRLHRRKQFDLLHGHWAVPGGTLAALSASLAELPLVISLHGSDVFVTEHSRVYAKLASYGYGRASEVTAVSEDLRVRAIALGADEAKATVVPSGVDCARYLSSSNASMRDDLGIPKSARIIVALGRLVHKKGFRHLISAMAEIARMRDDVYCVIGGEGDLYQELGTHIQQLQLSSRVRLLGHVRAQLTPQFFAIADVVAIPSIVDRFGNVDGLPLVLLEAMASGRPIVASVVGGIPEVLVDGCSGLLVPPAAPIALADAIVRLLEDDRLASRLGDQARMTALAEYDWSSIADRFLQIYSRALEGTNASRQKDEAQTT